MVWRNLPNLQYLVEHLAVLPCHQHANGNITARFQGMHDREKLDGFRPRAKDNQDNSFTIHSRALAAQALNSTKAGVKGCEIS